jgi:hypothetical protein
VFALVAICPAVVGVAVFAISILRRRTVRREDAAHWAEPGASFATEIMSRDQAGGAY